MLDYSVAGYAARTGPHPHSFTEISVVNELGVHGFGHRLASDTSVHIAAEVSKPIFALKSKTLSSKPYIISRRRGEVVGASKLSELQILEAQT